MDRTEELILELRELIAQYRAEVVTSRRTWPKSIRDRALELQRLNISSRQISRETGIPFPTLYLWSRAVLKSQEGVNAGSFHQVTVTRSRQIKKPRLRSTVKQGLTVELPNGIRASGLEIGDLIELVRRLR